MCGQWLLILLALTFTEEKFFILVKSSLSIIYFMDCALGVVSKKSLPYPWSSKFSPLLSWKFIALYFTFRSMSHFELIFVKGVRPVSRFCYLLIYLNLYIQVLRHHLLKRLSQLHCNTFSPKISLLYICGLISVVSIINSLLSLM